MEPVGPKVVAKWLGVSQRSVTDMAERGLAVRLGHGKYDLPATVARYTAHLREVAAGRGGEAQVLDLTAERARQAKETADGLALKNEQVRRTLLPAAVVEQQWSEILLKIRGRLMAVPSRVRSHAGLNAELTAAIDREIRDCLNDLADDEGDPPTGACAPSSAT
jgi:phage terminase Nu1 subunit (DNA packaging protein)